ncbi:hypothetical protein [Solemya velum gill symbiont]|nr:hypothetical protein [Solemya velum gill symbiont]
MKCTKTHNFFNPFFFQGLMGLLVFGREKNCRRLETGLIYPVLYQRVWMSTADRKRSLNTLLTAQFQIGHVYRCDNMKNNTTTDKEDNTGHETGDHRRVDFSVKIERGYAADNSSQITDHSYNHADFLRGAALIQNWTWFDAAPVQSGGSNVSG